MPVHSDATKWLTFFVCAVFFLEKKFPLRKANAQALCFRAASFFPENKGKMQDLQGPGLCVSMPGSIRNVST